HPFVNYKPEVAAKDAAVPYGLRKKSRPANSGGGGSRPKRRRPSGRRTP
ncbi:MAG: hypothetical protein HN525_09375, partial [Candidatus Marinimicrobia bacterium]|nr:hypothetical protein [Candidatus Neomarinimicrobiota bacterium]